MWGEVFDRASDTYDASPLRFFDVHAAAMVREAEIPAGAHVLDVATGTGKVAAEAARAAGENGRVVGIDVSDAMLDVARRRAGNLPVEFRRMDALRLEFKAQTFDVALCGFAITFFPDIVRGLREMARVLKPGGRVAFSTMAANGLMPIKEFLLVALEGIGIPRPAPHPEPWKALDRPAHVETALAKARFRSRRATEHVLRYPLESVEECWTVLWGSAWRGPLSRLPDDDLRKVKNEILRKASETIVDGRFRLDASAIFGIGTRRRARGWRRTANIAR